MGESLYNGLPPFIWDGVIAAWNRQQYGQGRPDLLISVEYAPLLKAIYEEGKLRQG